MPAVVTVNAKRPKVPPIERDLRVGVVVRRQPDHVVDVLSRSVEASLQAVLAERMLLQVCQAASLPGRAVVEALRDAAHVFLHEKSPEVITLRASFGA